MNGSRHSDLELAERHVVEAEVRIARQQQLIDRMERDKHPEVAARARAILVTFNATLELMREHLELLRSTSTQA